MTDNKEKAQEELTRRGKEFNEELKSKEDEFKAASLKLEEQKSQHQEI